MCTSPLAAMPHVKSGRLRALAMTGAKRSSSAPDIPTVAETLPGFQTTLWYALLAPAGTPQPIIRRVHTDAVKIIKSPEFTQQLQSQGAEPVGNSPQELQSFIRQGNRAMDPAREAGEDHCRLREPPVAKNFITLFDPTAPRREIA